MPTLPISPNHTTYRGRNEARRREVQEANALAWRIVRHVNALIATDPREIQRHDFHSIASALGLTVSEVRRAIGSGGDTGISVRVTEEDRQALELYRTPPAESRYPHPRSRFEQS